MEEKTKSLQDVHGITEDNTPDLVSASDSGDDLSLVDEGEILPEADLTQDEQTTIQRSTRVRVPIKRPMDEQTLFQESQGSRQNGNSMKNTSSILEEAYQQRVNIGYFKSQGVS